MKNCACIVCRTTTTVSEDPILREEAKLVLARLTVRRMVQDGQRARLTLVVEA